MTATEYQYTREDFNTPAPYEDVLSIANPFEREVATNQLAEYAKVVGINATGFKRMLKAYMDSKELGNRMVYVDNVTLLHRAKAGARRRRMAGRRLGRQPPQRPF